MCERILNWQDGYAAFSASPSMVDKTAAYIANQHKHHREKGFKEELRTLLKKHKVDYDERYVWD
ncbi:MAG: hypothetical protein WD048_07225 [Chitinophagales bacterium]